jgi:hypothetical protein
MTMFRNTITGQIARLDAISRSVTADELRVACYSSPELDYIPYHLESAAVALGEGWQLGMAASNTFYPYAAGAALPAHDRVSVHYEENAPVLVEGVATRSLVLRANSTAEVAAAHARQQASADWDGFEVAVLTAPLMHSMILSAFPKASAACIGLGAAIARARDTGNTAALLASLTSIAAASSVEQQDLANFVAALSGYNLPAAFINALTAAITA